MEFSRGTVIERSYTAVGTPKQDFYLPELGFQNKPNRLGDFSSQFTSALRLETGIHADLHILMPDGHAAESVLGVLVLIARWPSACAPMKISAANMPDRIRREMPCGHPKGRSRSHTVQAE
jgi:hypothetical protein